MVSICDCGCGFETGSTEFQKIHVDFDEIEKQEIIKHEYDSGDYFGDYQYGDSY